MHSTKQLEDYFMYEYGSAIATVVSVELIHHMHRAGATTDDRFGEHTQPLRLVRVLHPVQSATINTILLVYLLQVVYGCCCG